MECLSICFVPHLTATFVWNLMIMFSSMKKSILCFSRDKNIWHICTMVLTNESRKKNCHYLLTFMSFQPTIITNVLLIFRTQIKTFFTFSFFSVIIKNLCNQNIQRKKRHHKGNPYKWSCFGWAPCMCNWSLFIYFILFLSCFKVACIFRNFSHSLSLQVTCGFGVVCLFFNNIYLGKYFIISNWV